MTPGAVLTMVLTMSIVSGFAVYFFWKILITPSRSDAEEDEESGG